MTKKLTTRQAAEILNLSITTVTMYCKNGRIRCCKNGKYFYDLDLADVMKFAGTNRKLGRPITALKLPENFDLSILDNISRQVIEMRLDGLSLQKIGDHLGFSRQRIQQIQAKAQAKALKKA